jgi:hypothetical protein
MGSVPISRTRWARNGVCPHFLGRLGLLLVLLALPAHAMARFALVAGNNRGAPNRQKLWFAEHDAERLSKALIELGEFPPEHVSLLRSATRETVLQALNALEVQVRLARQSGERTLLVVFFSGHARGEGLELGDDTLGFNELKERIEGSQADVKVAIVDACEAGALTQVKGLKAAPELDFPLPADESAQGVAYIASTAVGEAAQESVRLGGSFFTVHLETALRGAGDVNGDGQVTLAEAFQYTASRTVSGTSTTEEGPQHPTYSFKMSGRGDVVLSELRHAEANLTLPGDTKVAYVLSTSNGALLAESGGGVTLALPAGKYRVDRRSDGALARGDVTLVRGQTVVADALTPLDPEPVRRKGAGQVTELYAGVQLGSAALAGSTLYPGARLGVRVPLGRRLGLRLAADYLPGRGESQGLTWSMNRLGATAALLIPLFAGSFRVELGPELGYGVSVQSLPNARTYAASEGIAGAAASLTKAFGPILIGAQVGGGVRLFSVNSVFAFGPVIDGGLVVGVEL